MIQYHTFPPIYNENSNILILGSFPSVKSRDEGFFYGHPQNRFWKVISAVFGDKTPVGIKEKKDFLISRNIALWDVIHSCEIEGSSDNSIKNVIPNDLKPILEASKIKKIFVNGKTAEKLYCRYIKKDILLPVKYLPSTSPANAAWTIDRLTEAWRAVAFD